MTELTDREVESEMFAMQDKHRALMRDGWMRIEVGNAAFSKNGKYLDISGNKIAGPKPAKSAPKVVLTSKEPDEAA